jgi:hypothetical protein
VIALREQLPPVLMMETSRQLHAALRLLPDAPDGCPPGQRLTAAAVLTEAAEAKTCDAEACTICADWPGLCYTCQILSGQASSLRELAAELSREVTTWASTSGCPASGEAVAPRGTGRRRPALAAPLDGRWRPRVEHRGGPVSACRPDRHRQRQ